MDLTIEDLKKVYKAVPEPVLRSFAEFCTARDVNPFSNEVSIFSKYDPIRNGPKYQWIVDYHKILSWCVKEADYVGYTVFYHREIERPENGSTAKKIIRFDKPCF